MMRILVTGCAGFLGSHLSQRLLERGDEVIGVDNISTGNKRNMVELVRWQSFEFIRHDITFPLYLEVDAIFNLASAASPIHYQRDPVQTTKSSVLGAVNLLGLAKRLSVPILQASTSEVYGDPAEHPQTEGYFGNVNPIGPRACYDEGKRVAETLFFDYWRQHDVPIRVARIFNTYGPKMAENDGRIISNFISQAIKNEPLTVYGDGEQSRSFCYVDDTVRGLIQLMETGFIGPVNIGNPDERTVKDIAERIILLTNSTSKIEFHDLPTDDPKKRCPDISLARRELNWEPEIGLDEGLEKTIAYFREITSFSSASTSSP